MVVPPSGVLAATALGIYEAHGERMSIMVVVAGPRTRELARVRVEDELTVLGPLGNGFFLNDLSGRVDIVAGGVGLASVLTAAQAVVAAGVRCRLLYGARNVAALVDRELFIRSGAEVVCATDDGSYGHHGFVTDLLRDGTPASVILACGPGPMLRSVDRIVREIHVPAQLSLEEHFACGVGACWGCTVPVDRASAQAPSFPPSAGEETRTYVHARVCKEGPVFWAHDLRW